MTTEPTARKIEWTTYSPNIKVECVIALDRLRDMFTHAGLTEDEFAQTLSFYANALCPSKSSE